MVVFEHGEYFVKVNDEGTYSITNKVTQVEECRVLALFDAINFCRTYDARLREAKNPVKSNWHIQQSGQIN